jgi:conjugal transfer ATP-binding protein TraC
VNITTPKIRTQRASDLVNLDAYTREDHLLFSKADGDKSYVGRVYVARPLLGGGSEFANVIVNVIKSMPDDSVIQVSLLCTPDHDAAHTFGKNKDRGSAVVTELVERQKSVFNAALEIGWKEDMPALNVRRVVISPAVPITRITPEVIEESKHQHAEFLGNIKGCGFNDARVLSAAEVVGLYREFADPFSRPREVELDELVEVKLQIFGPDESFDFRDQRVGVLNGKTYCAAVTCKAFPERVNHGLMNLVSGAPFNQGPTREGGGLRIATPYVLTTTIRVANQRKEQTRLTRAIDSRKQNQKLPFKLGSEDPAAKLADLQTIQRQCAEGDNKFVYVSTTLFAYGRTAEQAVKAASAVKGTLDQLHFDGRQVVGNGVVRWAQMLPLNFSPRLANELASEALMSASAAGCLLPVYGDNLGNAGKGSTFTGAAFLTRRGSVHYFDPFVSDSNYCGTIAAMGGSGKSFLIQYLIETQLAEGTHVFALDNGRSLKKFCHAVGGEFNEFGGSNGFRPSLNPFTWLTDDEFDEQHETITALLLLMAYEDEPVAPGAKIALTEAVKAAWGQQQEECGIEDVVASLKITQASGMENSIRSDVVLAAGNLVPRLTAFIESPSRGQYFRGPGTLNPRQQFTVFELGSLGEDTHLRKCVLFFLMNLLITRIKKISGRKMILADEAHDLLEDENAAAVVEGVYRKGRKDRVAIWVVVQSLLKLAEHPAGLMIINQSAWKLILAQVHEEVEKVLAQKILSAFADDPYFCKMLKSVETRKGQFSEVLVLGTKSFEVVRLYVDRFTAALFSSEGDARDAVFEMMERGIPAVQAVQAVMGETKSTREAWLRSVVQQMKVHDGLTAAEILAEVAEVLE